MSSELPEASRNIRRSSTELLAASRNLRRTSADIGAASLSILPVRGELGAASLSIWQPNAALETKSQEVPICTATLTARSLTFRAFAVDCFARFQVLRRRLALLPPVTPVVGSYFVPGTYQTFAAKCSPTDPVARNELLWELAEPWRMIRYGSRPISLAADTSHRGWMCLSTCSPEAAPSSQPAPSAPQARWACSCGDSATRVVQRIPTGFRPPAQGCEARATLGYPSQFAPTPTGLRRLRSEPGHNPVGVAPHPVSLTQGSSCLATLGWRTQALWAWFVQQAEWFAGGSPCWALASPYFTFSIR